MKEQGKGDGRNSAIRDITRGPMNALSKITHELFPKLTPNQVTLIGVAGVATTGLAAYWLEKKEVPLVSKERAATVIAYVLFSLCDMFDGALARYLKEQGIELDGNLGQLVDVAADRLQELILALIRIAIAYERRDILAVLTAFLSALTNGLPSYYRAEAESRGYEVNENGGGGILGAAGTRGGRFFTAGASTFAPKTTFPVSALIDGLNTYANIHTARVRRRVALNKKSMHQEVTDETREKAAKRKKLLAGLLGVSAVSSLGLVAYLGYNTYKNRTR